MTTIAQLLREKGQAVWSVAPEASAHQALTLMVEKDVEALTVVEGGRLVGLLTERECARNLDSPSGRDIRVREIMIEAAVCVRPEETVEACLALMVTSDIRHLPVLAEGRLLGVVSILDVGRAALARRPERVIRQPERRLTGYALN